MKLCTLDIVIVNWNTKGQLRECLESIAAADLKDFELRRVVVVDNGSTDNSATDIQGIELPLKVIHNAVNLGFAAACNQGALEAEADYLLFLNPDTRLYRDSLWRPVAFMQRPENERIGIVGVQLEDESGNVSITCARFPSVSMYISKMTGLNVLLPRMFPSYMMTEWDYTENRVVEQVIGAFFLIRRPLFEELGRFDERFFVYFEEVDISYRAAMRGWNTYYLADVRAFHRGQGSSHQVQGLRLFYSLRSRILYGLKHFGGFSAFLLIIATIGIEPAPRIIISLIRKSSALETVHGYMLLWTWVVRTTVVKIKKNLAHKLFRRRD
ncbi:MAG: glycosyltransferase family 2 protein [Nitrospiraceae bacterium]|nr:glycosyltransferase family 2 protein [Nitrospiraceae bacterium]